MLIENHSCSCPDALFELAMQEARGRALHARYVTNEQLEDIIDKSLNKFNLLKYRETYDIPDLIEELRDVLHDEWYDLAHEASFDQVYGLGLGGISLVEAITGIFENFNLGDESLSYAEGFLESWAELNCEEAKVEAEQAGISDISDLSYSKFYDAVLMVANSYRLEGGWVDEVESAFWDSLRERYAYLIDEADPPLIFTSHESLYYQFAEDLEKRYGQVDWKDDALYFEEGPFLCRFPSLDEIIDKMECIRQPDVPAFLRRQIKRELMPIEASMSTSVMTTLDKN